LDNLYSSAVDLDVSSLLTGVCSPQKTLLDPCISPFNTVFVNTLERTIPEWFNLGRVVLCSQCSRYDEIVKGCGSCGPQFSRDANYVVDDDLLIYQASAMLVMKHWCKVDKEHVLEMDVAISKLEVKVHTYSCAIPTPINYTYPPGGFIRSMIVWINL
jgi:hypothetical protein